MKKKRVRHISKAISHKDGSGIIVCNGVSKQYGKNKVLENLNLTIKQGEIFGIIGMSGSGKTTLLNILIGFLQPEAGDVHFNTDKGMMPISKAPNKIKPLFGFAPQDPSFYPKLTAQENLEYFATMYNISRSDIQKSTAELLKLVELSGSKNNLAKELSFGMQKRLGIACALVHKPKVLILDEPTADLDPILRRETWELISKVNKAGTTIIVASHLLDELESECDRIAVLHDGKISKIGSIEQLKKLYTTNNEVILATASKNYRKIMSNLRSKRKLRVSKITQKDSTLVLQTPNAEEVLVYLMKAIKRSKDHIVKLHIARPSLEEVFISAHNK
jgi:ABC-2 type transport system ATP-binding protein